MNNARIYNGALVGALSGMSLNRVETTSSATVATCVAFATAVDNAISPIVGGASAGQQELITHLAQDAMTNAYATSIPTAVVTKVVAAFTLAVSALAAEPSSGGSTTRYSARNVSTQAVTDLSSFSVSTDNDGITNVEGDVVILAGLVDSSLQAVTLRGPFVVGAVDRGIAPLTRPSWYTGSLVTGMQECVVDEGATFNGTVWNSFHIAATFTVGTTDGVWFMPYTVNFQVGLVNGSSHLHAPVLSYLSGFAVTRTLKNFDEGADPTIMYDLTLRGGTGNDGVGYDVDMYVNAWVSNTVGNNADSSVVTVTVSNNTSAYPSPPVT